MSINPHCLPYHLETLLRKALALSAKNNIKVVTKVDNLFVVITPEMTMSDAVKKYEETRYQEYMEQNGVRLHPKAERRIYTRQPNNDNLYNWISMALVKKTIQTAVNIAKKDKTFVMVALDFDETFRVNGETDVSKSVQEYYQTIDRLGRMDPCLRIRLCDLQR